MNNNKQIYFYEPKNLDNNDNRHLANHESWIKGLKVVTQVVSNKYSVPHNLEKLFAV